METITVILHHVGHKELRAEVPSLEDASKLVTRFQDMWGMGASDCAVGHGDILKNGRWWGRVAYNGVIRHDL